MPNANCLTLGIDHLGLSVRDLAQSVDFFVNCLGWQEFGGNSNYPSIYVTDGISKLTLWQTKSNTPKQFDRHQNVGLHHVALKLATEADLNIVYDRLKNWPRVKVEFAPELSGQGPKIHFMINEPSGNRIEFSFDPR
ncbi:MAG: VOC family protein [Rhizobiales bacterium]|nr:VOC family protein [Hyphomicrobiales bacterium]NRB14854.1 VOC family protein [Hyphomicrobiales bacterium]